MRQWAGDMWQVARASGAPGCPGQLPGRHFRHRRNTAAFRGRTFIATGGGYACNAPLDPGGMMRAARRARMGGAAVTWLPWKRPLRQAQGRDHPRGRCLRARVWYTAPGPQRRP